MYFFTQKFFIVEHNFLNFFFPTLIIARNCQQTPLINGHVIFLHWNSLLIWDNLYIFTKYFLIGAHFPFLEVPYEETALFHWNS